MKLVLAKSAQNQAKFAVCREPMQIMGGQLGVKQPSPLLVWYMYELYRAQVCLCQILKKKKNKVLAFLVQ